MPSGSTAGWSAAAGSPGRGGDENEPPPWLVFGGMIRTVSMAEGEPGLRPLAAALEDEGFDDAGSGRLVESFARHLMVDDRCLAGEGLRRGAQRTIRRGCRPSRASGATSTTTAICWCGAWARPSVERRRALPRSRRRPGSIRATGGPPVKLIAHHPARSIGHLRVRARGRAGRMGGLAAPSCSPTSIPKRSTARRARHSAAAFSACSRWAGRRWCRSSRRARRTAASDRCPGAALTNVCGAPDLDGGARRGRGGNRVRRLALRPSARHADRRASQLRGRRDPRGVPHLASARRPKPLRAFSFLEVEGEDEPAEQVDLVGLARESQRG